MSGNKRPRSRHSDIPPPPDNPMVEKTELRRSGRLKLKIRSSSPHPPTHNPEADKKRKISKTQTLPEYQKLLDSLFNRPLLRPPPPYTVADLKPPSQILKGLKNDGTLIHEVPSLPRRVPSILKGVGMVAGKLIYREDGHKVDCSVTIPWGAKAIPWDINVVKGMKTTDALFILLLGNDSTFMRLAESSFFDRFPCIMVTAEGPPDFLYMMNRELNLPVLALVNCDPHSLKILLFYARVLKNNIKWLAIRPNDVVKHVGIPTLPMTKKDIKIGNQLFKDDFVMENQKWFDELKIMMDSKQKAEIEALVKFKYTYFDQVFLPIKLQQKDWI